SRRLNCFLNDRHLALVELEVDKLPRLCLPPGQFLLDRLLEVFLRHLAAFVQPGCTIEALPVPPRQFHRLDPLRPAHFLQFFSGLRWQVFVDRHQVVRLPPRLRETPLQKLVETLQTLQPPVLSRPHLAEIAPQFEELGVALRLLPLLPRQNLVNLAQYEYGSATIELR